MAMSAINQSWSGNRSYTESSPSPRRAGAGPGAQSQSDETHHEPDADRLERRHPVGDTGRILHAYQSSRSANAAPRSVMVFACQRKFDRGAVGETHRRGEREATVADLDGAGRHIGKTARSEPRTNGQPTASCDEAGNGVGVGRTHEEPDGTHQPGGEHHGDAPADDPDADRIDDGDFSVAVRVCQPPTPDADEPERAGRDQVARDPTPAHQPGLHRIVDDEPFEAPPPGPTNVDGQVPRRNRPIVGEASEHVLQHQALMGAQGVALKGRGRRPHAGEFLEIVIGRQDSQPTTGGEVHQRCSKCSGGDRGIVGQHVDHARSVGSQCCAARLVRVRPRRHEPLTGSPHDEHCCSGERHSEPEPAG